MQSVAQRLLLLLLMMVPARWAAADAIKKIAMVPLTSLGSEAPTKGLRALSDEIAAQIAKMPKTSLLAPKSVDSSLTQANRPGFSACDGRSSCLAELGKVAGAELVVYGEAGGLGGAQVIYLKLVDVERAVDLRSTTLELSSQEASDELVEGAVTRLLAPKLYRGSLLLKLDVKGASLYIDGAEVGLTPGKPLSLPVGSHAVRATHPEYRDFVRFVDIEFKQTVSVTANMQQFPIVASEIRKYQTKQQHRPPPTIARSRSETPWYRRWYTIAGAGTAAFITSAVVFAIIADGIDADVAQSVDVPEL